MKYRDLAERLFYNSILDPATECWEWIGRINNSGYPCINVYEYGKHQKRYAHRVAYSELTGKRLRNGIEMDHRCYNTACINPEHLQSVTKSTNLKNRRYY